MKHDAEFAQTVLRLEAVAGPLWETYVRFLTQYKEQCIKDLLASGPETVQACQGRARGADEILSAIRNARHVSK